ncbi:MAG: AAA-like domain-containing protein [Spirulina sp.]
MFSAHIYSQQIEMKVTKLIEVAEIAVADATDYSLNPLQKTILQECCQNEPKTYEQIAFELNYSPSYLKKKLIPMLWKILSKTFNEKVTKANCRSILEKNIVICKDSQPNAIQLERPEGPVSLDSPFYIHRFNLERLGYEELLEPGALLCLRGTSKVGKTSLLLRLLDRMEKQGYRKIRLSLNRASTEILSSVEKFLRWFCANITQQLEAEIRLQEFWCDEVGALTNCSFYLQQYLLSRSPSPIVVALDNLERLFAYPTIAHDFLSLLRSWYEEAKNNPLWQKLRIVLVYSTEAHLLFENDKTPVNISSILDVLPFNATQIRELASYHRLYLSSIESDRLHALLGGFPDLVRQILYYAVRNNRRGSELLSDLVTDGGSLSDRLSKKLHWLSSQPDLLVAYRQVVNSERPLKLEPHIAFQLQSLGLICQDDDGVTVSCELYRQYFYKHLN